MGRAGVTLFDIENAIQQLQGRGKAPTVDNIRELLGTGSKSTIIQHLKSWKSKNTEAQGKLPGELLSLVTGLWERLNQQADQRIIDIETSSNSQLQEVKQNLYQTQSDYNELKNKFHTLEELFSKEQQTNTENSQQIQHHQQEFAKLNERYQAAALQINEHKSENTRLHQLANNIQANLEHYQQAVQQQKTEHNLFIENQQMQFKKELNELQQHILNYQKQHQEALHQIHEKNGELQRLGDQHSALQKNHNELNQMFQQNSNELSIYKDRYEQNQKQISTLQNTLHEKAQQFIQLEKELAVLIDQRDKLQKTLSNTDDKMEALRQEKLFLIQEKSDLLGQLKYFHEKKSKIKEEA